MEHSTLKFIIALFIFNMALVTTLSATPGRRENSLNVLRKEITRAIQNNTHKIPDILDQVVTVGFLINAKNELIILDVNGDSALACAYVKQILNYSKVKYHQVRQLIRYSIRIHLVNGTY